MSFLFFVIAIVVMFVLPYLSIAWISGRKLPWTYLALGFLVDLGLNILTIVYPDLAVITFSSEIITKLLVSYLLFGKESKTLAVFYAFFTSILFNLFHRSLVFFLLPMFGWDKEVLWEPLGRSVSGIVCWALVFFFLKWLGYDFSQLWSRTLDEKDRKVLTVTNYLMIGYFFLNHILIYLEQIYQIDTVVYRQFIVVVYLVFFMGVVYRLDRHIKERLQDALLLQKERQLQDLERYSQHIEGLYREVRGFRHDYANLLTTLRLGIDNQDLSLIEEVYQSVFKGSNASFRHQKYDVGRLIHLDNPALKSLLAVKFMQAAEQGIAVSLEVPNPISPKGIELLDFITIASILCDNAIEATMETEQPSISIAYLSLGDKQLFIVENTTKEESVALANLTDFGKSSKGEGRGIGLYTVREILNGYLNVSLNTSSRNHTFCQVLEIMVEK